MSDSCSDFSRLLATVQSQAQTIQTQTETIARLLMDDADGGEVTEPERAQYLDGSYGGS